MDGLMPFWNSGGTEKEGPVFECLWFQYLIKIFFLISAALHI